MLNLYCISVKEDAQCVLRYGPHNYDFREGLMTFFKPGQAITVDPTSSDVKVGYSVVFHPDFIRTYDLANNIGSYSFFDYEVNEALFLSEKEKQQIRTIEKAKDLLSRSQLSVAEIAYQLGFEQPQSLNRLFKKKTSVSPREFRRTIGFNNL
ncbi:hypothetical protein QE382_002365 [Sphingobacterium zeae]|uniref:HTH araC/xylS-type domain-containing protein n=1 Tax=Sphingobacterium zeae TaxID=1776859 RepID=A0ABU0U5Z9_9SPHI|nr:helix-turn-helix domain-containing protein [Sphingobacterium zeae]MDQ1150381.1 hypothetical protein [Sphingobacterium zeae]